MPPSPPRADVPEAVRVQILATEHWSLLATRSITYSAIFSRTNIFLTVVSAAVVALALVAQATDFGDRFYVFALLVLPVTLFIGVATFIRIVDARLEDFWLVYGMNRLSVTPISRTHRSSSRISSRAITTIRRACTRPTAHTRRCGSTACSQARP